MDIKTNKPGFKVRYLSKAQITFTKSKGFVCGLLIFGLILGLGGSVSVQGLNCGGLPYAPCNCGDTLMTSYTLSPAVDPILFPIGCNSGQGDALTIGAPGITLDCNFSAIFCNNPPNCVNNNLVGIYNKAGYSNVTIKNCNVQGYLDGIRASNATNNTIINNTLTANTNGIYVDGINNGLIADNTANSNKDGIILYSSINVAVTNNTARLNSWDGLGMFNSSGNNLTNNNLTNNGIKGFYYIEDKQNQRVECNNSIDTTNLVGNSKPVLYYHDTSGITIQDKIDVYGMIFLCNVSHSVIDNVSVINGDGILLYHTNNVSVANSLLNMTKGCGFLLWYSKNDTIRNNRFYNANDDNINICGAENNLIFNNDIASLLSGSHEGIHMYELSSNNTIRNNTVHNHAISGIASTPPTGSLALCSLGGPNNYNVIENNTIYNNGLNITGAGGWDGSGIFIAGANYHTIRNNVIYSNNQSGIRIVDYYSGDALNNTIINNTITSNGLHGILLDDVGFSGNVLNTTIINNTVKNNQQHGIYINVLSSGNAINSNTFCSNNQSGGTYYDIYDADSNSGDNNTCNTTIGWSDPNTPSCTLYCNPDIEAANDSASKNDFVINEPIYAKGTNVARKQVNNVCVYITANRTWNDGDNISPYVSMHTVNTNGTGSLNSFLENATTIGYYDMVLDVDCDGRYNAYRDNIDMADVNYGFYITPEPMAAILFAVGVLMIYGFVRIREKK